MARVGKNDKYKLKVDEYRTEKKQDALVYSAPGLLAIKLSNTHMVSDELSEADFSALVESLLDDENGVESKFLMLKCSMIEDGTYYEKN